MRKNRAKRAREYMRKHALVIASLLCATLVVLGMIAWYAIATDNYVQRTNAATAQTIAQAQEMAKITAEKKAKQIAEETARKEAAAKDAAEQAKRGGGGAIDAKACNASTSHINPASIDVVVNKKHCIQPLTYTPGDLVTSHNATLSAKAIQSFNQLYDAAAAAGQPFYVTSSYRSYTTQISTYNRWVSISGKEGADTYSARPGYSEHQTGFAFDVAASGCTLDCFGSTSQYRWFLENAARYGFIQRYYAGYEAITGYKAEEWHYRYVGAEVAQDMQAKGIKTLEQYWGISGGDY